MKPPGIITSRRHALVEELRTIRDDQKSPFLFLEGPRLVQEALQSGQRIDILVWTPSADREPVLKAAVSGCRRTFQVSESVFRAVSDVESPQGILAVIRRPQWEWKDLFNRAPAPILVLDRLQNPGNLASIIRTAEAAGAAGLVTTPGTARLFSPKALRGAMGSTLRLPSQEHRPTPEITSKLKNASYTLVAATLSSKEKSAISYTQLDWHMPRAVLLGQEGCGFSADWEPFIEKYVYIPMQSPVESLNVAAAAAILLYESARRSA